jgi:hypothetical protein
MRDHRRRPGQAVFCSEDRSLYGRTPYHGHTQAQSAAKLGSHRATGPSLSPAPEGAQFSHRRAKLPTGAINSEQGYRGIGCFGHLPDRPQP